MNIGLYGRQGDDLKKRQTLLFGQPETEWLANSAVACLQEHPDPEGAAVAVAALFNGNDAERNFSAFRNSQTMPAHIIGALQGRMVTADNHASIEGALHVAHAFTIHPEQPEIDFFTVIDDIRAEQNDQGSASLYTTEINSGIFYLYMVVDMPLLTSNTTGCSIQDWLGADREIAAHAAANVAALAATALDGAKLGSTAAHERAQVVLAEMGEFHPRSLAGAFTVPAHPTISDGLSRLTQHLAEMDRIYGAHEDRMLIAPGQDTNPGMAPLLDPELHHQGGRLMDRQFLILRLEAPMMSFGTVAVDNHRPSTDMPGLSMLTGLLARALGWNRPAHAPLTQALQARVAYAARAERTVRDGNAALEDYQTAQLSAGDAAWTTRGRPETRAGSPQTNATSYIRTAEYRTDLRVTVALELLPPGPAPTLPDLAQALQFPASVLFIGRKNCLPSHPIFQSSVHAENPLAALHKVPSVSPDAEDPVPLGRPAPAPQHHPAAHRAGPGPARLGQRHPHRPPHRRHRHNG